MSNALRLIRRCRPCQTGYTENRIQPLPSSSKVSATIYNNAINPAEVYIQTSALLTQREAAQRALFAESTAVSLVDGFKLTNMPYSKSLSWVLIMMGLIGLFGGLLAGMLVEARQYIL